MAIRGSSLDPIQQALDTANAMGSVIASNKEVKKAIDSLKASLTDASKNRQSTVDRMLASVDRSTAAMIEYFRTQRSSDLIKKSNEQVKATSALASAQDDKTKQNAADAEVNKYAKNSEEINKNIKNLSTNFSGPLGKIQELLGDKQQLLQGADNLGKLTEGIKSGKINGLNSFSRMTGIDVKGMDKNVIAPLVSELIEAVKSGKTLEQAVNGTESVEDEEISENDGSEEKTVVDIIPETDFRKKICDYIDAENEKREKEEEEKKKNKKDSDKKHRTLKELLEESNILSKIGIIGHIASVATKLLPWLAGAWGIWSIIKDVRKSVNIIEDTLEEKKRHRNRADQLTNIRELKKAAHIGVRSDPDNLSGRSAKVYEQQGEQLREQGFKGYLDSTKTKDGKIDESKALQGYISLLTDQFVELLDTYTNKIKHYLKSIQSKQWDITGYRDKYENYILNHWGETARTLADTYREEMEKAKSFQDARNIHNKRCATAAKLAINTMLTISGNLGNKDNNEAFITDTYAELKDRLGQVVIDEKSKVGGIDEIQRIAEEERDKDLKAHREGKPMWWSEKSRSGTVKGKKGFWDYAAIAGEELIQWAVPGGQYAWNKWIDPTIEIKHGDTIPIGKDARNYGVFDESTNRYIIRPKAINQAASESARNSGTAIIPKSAEESEKRPIETDEKIHEELRKIRENSEKSLEKQPKSSNKQDDSLKMMLNGSTANDVGYFLSSPPPTNRPPRQ